MRGSFRLLRTQAFRIIFIYALLFAFSVSALLAFTSWNTRRALDAQADQTIEAEITGLAEQYQRLGLSGLAQSVTNRALQGEQGIYLLADQAHRPIAGNLDTWPAHLDAQGNFVEFNYERHTNGGTEARQARGRVFPVAGNFSLLVAQDVQERYLTQHMFTTTLPWTMALILVLGVIGGALMSRNMLRRLDSINRTSAEIIAGDLSRRVPVAGAGDEFDALAENLNRMLDRIERLMKGMREVTDSVAHDLRTPLNRLRNRLEQQLSHPEARDKATIEAAIAETDQLIGTFNALLLIAETDAGAGRAAMTPLDLSDVAEDVCELYEPLAEEKGIVLTLQAQPAPIEGNRSLIAQALANLVDNAIKYTPGEGRVVIEVLVQGERVTLAVRDTGPGIAPQDRVRVVERFVRLEASRNSPGTGLGLSLVAAVAHFHGTRLTLDDNHPGLVASLTFPRAVRAVAPRGLLKSAAE